MTILLRLPRMLLLVTIAAVLLAGLTSGLSRLGWQMGPTSSDWMLVHGPLMISGFLGTLICLERAVALMARYPGTIAIPMVNALGALVLLLSPDATLAKLLLTAGSLGLVMLFVLMVRLHPSRDVFIMALGALCWLAGNRLWLGGEPVYQAVHLWTAFLLLTIFGERLELSRVRRLTPTAETLLVLAIGVYLLGVVVTIVSLDAGIRLSGLGALLIAGWLLRYDIARRTARQNALPRFIAMCLLIGYGWLGIGGVIGMWYGALYAGPEYAALLHAYLLGFVFSMIFGHAPIILPALTGLRVSYTPLFYGPLLLLHLSLIYRMIGNFTLDFSMRQWGGLLNVLAILLFIGLMMVTVILSNSAQLHARSNEPR